MQIHRTELRTTLDIDIAITDIDRLPVNLFKSSGFVERGRHAHFYDWIGPGETPVQFTDDAYFHPGVLSALSITVGDGVATRVLPVENLLHAKLLAAGDPARRRSKRFQDLSDAQALIEDHPNLEAALSDDERCLLERGIV